MTNWISPTGVNTHGVPAGLYPIPAGPHGDLPITRWFWPHPHTYWPMPRESTRGPAGGVNMSFAKRNTLILHSSFFTYRHTLLGAMRNLKDRYIAATIRAIMSTHLYFRINRLQCVVLLFVLFIYIFCVISVLSNLPSAFHITFYPYSSCVSPSLIANCSKTKHKLGYVDYIYIQWCLSWVWR